MPDLESAPSRVFVLRLWLEPAGDGVGTWRASLLNPVSKHRLHFASPEQLSAYLMNLDLLWPEEDWEEDSREARGDGGA